MSRRLSRWSKRRHSNKQVENSRNECDRLSLGMRQSCEATLHLFDVDLFDAVG
jgi:hypothetical protein